MFKTEAKQKNKSKKIKAVKNSDKPVETTGEAKQKWYQHGFVFGILGIALLLVFVSIAYCVVVILMGTKGLTPKIMIAPAAGFDFVLALIAFTKIFK